MKSWHLVLLGVVSVIVIWVISDDVRSTPIDYVSGLGSVASVYAIIVAIFELKSAKKVARETKNAIDSKLTEVNQLLSYADVEKHIQICNSVSLSLQTNQYEAVAMKLDELKKILLEIKNNKSIKEKSEFNIQKMVMKLGTDISAVRGKWASLTDLDSSNVLSNVADVSTFLQDISAKLKHQTI